MSCMDRHELIRIYVTDPRSFAVGLVPVLFCERLRLREPLDPELDPDEEPDLLEPDELLPELLPEPLDELPDDDPREDFLCLAFVG